MRRRSIRRIAWYAFLAVIALGVISTAVVLVDGFTDEGEKADVALVLGNTGHPSGEPSARLKARLNEAVAVYRAGLAPVLLVSGGVGKEGHDEAKVMGEYLRAQGIPAEAIVIDSEGWTTGHSARNTAAWMRRRGATRAIVVTRYFHVARSKLALRQCGVRTVYGAHPGFFEPRDPYSLAREGAEWYAYRFRGCSGAAAPPDDG